MNNKEVINERTCPSKQGCNKKLFVGRLLREDGCFKLFDEQNNIIQVISIDTMEELYPDDIEDLLESVNFFDIGYCSCGFWGFIKTYGKSNEGALNYDPLVLNPEPLKVKSIADLYPSKRCLAKTKTKHRCKNGAIKGKNRCQKHIKSVEWQFISHDLGIED